METDERFVRVVRIVVGGSLGWPQSFVGPAANLSMPATLRVSVLPPAFATGWAGIGIGGQTKKNTDVGLHPDNATLAVWGNGSWCCLGSCGALAPLPRTMTTTWGNAPRWFELSVSLSLDVTGQQVLVASIDGTIVAHGVVSLGGGRWGGVRQPVCSGVLLHGGREQRHKERLSRGPLAFTAGVSACVLKRRPPLILAARGSFCLSFCLL